MKSRAGRVTKSRVRLLLDNPVYGHIILHLEVEFVESWLKTAATDGRKLYLNPDFVDSLSDEELVFLCAHEVLHCFPAGTIIPSNTFDTIEDCQIGDLVIGETGQQSSVTASLAHHIEGELVTIKARGLLPLKVTPEHPFLIRRSKWKTIRIDGTRRSIREWSNPEWKLAGDIKPNDWVHVPRIVPYISEHVMMFDFQNAWSVPENIKRGVLLDQEVAEFLGWYVAEGCTSEVEGRPSAPCNFVSSIVLNLKERGIAERLKSILQSRFGITVRVEERNETNSCIVTFASNPLGRWLRKHCGHLAHNIRMPSQILFNTDLDVVTAFLCAYTEGDGHVNRSVNFGTASKVLALQLQLVWARFGVLINLHERQPFDTMIRGKTIHCGVLYHGHTGWKGAFDVLGLSKDASRSTKYAGVIDSAVLTPVRSVTREKFSGEVFNLETDCHTYTAGNVVSHNCIFEHMFRRGNRNKDLWNMCCDLLINDLLIKSRIGRPIKTALHDPKYSSDDYTAEELYALLEQQAVKIQMPLDMHLDGDGGDDAEDGTAEGQVPSYSDAEKQAITDNIRSALIQGVQQQEGMQPGSTPAGILRLVEQLLRPKIDWREMLDHVMRSSIRYDYTYMRISRRFWSGGLVLPGSDVLDRVEAVACLDGSSSTTPAMIRDFLSECQGIMSMFRDFKLTVMTFDTEVYNVVEFTPDNADEIADYKFYGDGGTAPSCCWRYLREHGIIPDQLLIFTDGLVGSDWGEPDVYDTLFIIHSSNRIVAPYGRTTHYEARERSLSL